MNYKFIKSLFIILYYGYNAKSSYFPLQTGLRVLTSRALTNITTTWERPTLNSILLTLAIETRIN